MLNAVSGKQIRTFPATRFGGAVNATVRSTVVIGRNAVTSYSNSTGRCALALRDRLGPAGLGAQRGLAVRDRVRDGRGRDGAGYRRPADQLETGKEGLIQPVGGAFDGRLSGAFHGTLLFLAGDGLRMYNEKTGGNPVPGPGQFPRHSIPCSRCCTSTCGAP